MFPLLQWTKSKLVLLIHQSIISNNLFKKAEFQQLKWVMRSIKIKLKLRDSSNRITDYSCNKSNVMLSGLHV
jgi:hypothetical protein